MAFVEVLDRDFLQRVQDRQDGWARRFTGSGLRAPHGQEDLPLRTIVKCTSFGYWVNLFYNRLQQEREQRQLIGCSEHAYIPGIPNELVEEQIWPRVAKDFRQISAARHAEKETILSTLYSIRLLNKKWKHLVDFSYEWAVYRMVRKDFNEGWVWYSYYPTLKGPFTELSRMMDLLPDPSVPQVFPVLHKSMGVLPTDHLWIWRAYLNTTKGLRYDGPLHCGKDYNGYFNGRDPCFDCIFYPRLWNSTFPEREEESEDDDDPRNAYAWL